MQVKNVPRFTLLVFATAFIGYGCETAFEPLIKNHPYVFSMYGIVDLHGEVGKIRVMPIGESLIPADPEPNGTVVKLIRESTGESIVLADSLFRFGGSAYVWNYFTSEHLHENENYTIVAETPDGSQSSAAINLPSELPLPEVEYTESIERGLITGWSADPIVSMEIKYWLQFDTDTGCDSELLIVINHTKQIITFPDGRYRFVVANAQALLNALGPGPPRNIQVNKRELVIIASRDDWPDTSGLSEQEMVLPDLIKNVQNGTGVVAGVAGRRIEITPRKEPC